MSTNIINACIHELGGSLHPRIETIRGLLGDMICCTELDIGCFEVLGDAVQVGGAVPKVVL